MEASKQGSYAPPATRNESEGDTMWTRNMSERFEIWLGLALSILVGVAPLLPT